jgi:hypothetical protein
MSIRYLNAEKQTNQYYFRVLIDDTKENDPDYIREWTYALVLDYMDSGYENESAYIAMMKDEIPLLAQAELDKMNPQPIQAPTPLTGF